MINKELDKALALIALVCAILIGSAMEFSQSEREEVLNMPDAVYEYVTLQLPDNASDREILNYYNNHRATCDMVEIANL